MTAPDQLALAAMVAYCGWDPTLPVTDATVLLDGNGTTLLTLRSLHVTDVSAVSVTGWYDTVYAATIADPAAPGPAAQDVAWSENGTLTWQTCYPGSVWPVGARNVAVTYSGGYDTPPDDLAAALASVEKRTSTLGVSSRRMGTATVAFGAQYAAGGLLLVEQMVFDSYRIVKVA